MMLCNQEGCEQAQDFISFQMKEGENMASKEFTLQDLEAEKRWIQVKVPFKTSTTSVKVS